MNNTRARTIRLTLAAASLLSLSSLADTTAKALTQQQLNDFALHSDMRFGVISNFDAQTNGLKAHVLLHNQSGVTLPAGESNWRIYFHAIRNITAPDTAGLHLSHINGDLVQLAPTKDFAGLAPGANLEFPFSSGDWMISYSDFMPRAFIAQNGLTPAVFANTDTEDLSRFVEPFTRPEQELRYGAQGQVDHVPVVTPALRYDETQAQGNGQGVKPALLIPTPQTVKMGKGSATLDNQWQIRYAGRLTQEAKYLQQQLQAAGITLASQPDNEPVSGKIIVLRTDAKVGEEGYELKIDGDKIDLNGSDNAGAFYAVQSLLAMLPAGTASQFELPKLSISDTPRFHWRGMHYDVGRNFHSKAFALRLIDQMAHYKLNKLHIHLTDDEGWRLQIPGLPELTEIGAHRCFDLSETHCLLTQLGTGPSVTGSGNGFYSRDDFIEMLKYAAARHIEIIPEIDMPGHGRAAIKSMQARYQRLMASGQKEAAAQFLLSDPMDKSVYASVQDYTDDAINVCLDSTYTFVDKVVYELQQMYRDAGVKLEIFHMGGDETGKGAWAQSPACDALFAKHLPGVAGVADLKPYFVSRLAEITRIRGLALAGWEDGLMYDPANPFNRKQLGNDNVYANPWDTVWEWGVADRAYRLANAGYKVILTPATHLYFDHPYEANPAERGYYWAARYTDTAKVFGFMPDNYYANAQMTRDGTPITNLEALVGRPLPALTEPENIKGIQGAVWSESIRTDEQLEQMIYPRMFALAERAWHKAGWESDKPNSQARQQDWFAFTNNLTAKVLPKLAASGGSFHLPAPGAQVHDGKLSANVNYPGVAIEYSLDQGASWQNYTVPVALNGQPSVQLRTRLGQMMSRTVQVK